MRMGLEKPVLEQKETPDEIGVFRLLARSANFWTEPVIELEVSDPVKLPEVVSHKGDTQGQSMGSDQEIHRADGLPLPF